MDGVQDTSGGTSPTSLNPNPNPTPVPEMSTAALLECKLCDLTFETHEEKRQHAKSDWHVYKIRCKVAEPGVSITPPGIEPQRPASRQKAQKQTSRKPELESPAVDDENELKDKGASASDSDSESDDTPDPSDTDGVEFIPGACLFCDHTSDDLDNNLTHMRQTHSFLIPFQSSLAVDLQTLLWFIHMVIFSYRECICCGKRRRTVEAVQQHMVSTGHCRFDVSEETKMFYDQEVMDSQGVQAQARPDEQTLRLPSGKLLTRRPERVGEGSSGSRTRERLSNGKSALPAPEPSETADANVTSSPTEGSSVAQALTKKGRRAQALTAQFSRLRVGDQMALARLSEPERRAVLAAHKREVDKTRRAEWRQRRKLDEVGNKTAVHAKYYKQEVPVYMGG